MINKTIYNEEYRTLIENYINNLLEVIPHERITLYNNEIVLTIKKDVLRLVMLFLNKNSNNLYSVLTDIAGVDTPGLIGQGRFTIVYNLLSIHYSNIIRVKVHTDEITSIDSISDIYMSANWLEREVWDMYGVMFNNHPDLRRILTDYGFQGHPLRKDFPLTGFTEFRYDPIKATVIQEPLELAQIGRFFNTPRNW